MKFGWSATGKAVVNECRKVASCVPLNWFGIPNSSPAIILHSWNAFRQQITIIAILIGPTDLINFSPAAPTEDDAALALSRSRLGSVGRSEVGGGGRPSVRFISFISSSQSGRTRRREIRKTLSRGNLLDLSSLSFVFDPLWIELRRPPLLSN